MNTTLRQFTLPALAALALLGALPAHAVGRLADINLVDRDSGETLSVYRHQGEYWVAGRPGARYAVSVRNALPGRIMGVVSVDGVNVVSGQTAAWHQTGYVLGAWQQYDITGWRKTDNEVAAFHFTALPSSYAARTGRPAHVGVIGVAKRWRPRRCCRCRSRSIRPGASGVNSAKPSAASSNAVRRRPPRPPQPTSPSLPARRAPRARPPIQAVVHPKPGARRLPRSHRDWAPVTVSANTTRSATPASSAAAASPTN
jgi:hypothetical protein